jgi:ribosomal protection tetracycline resistance protein
LPRKTLNLGILAHVDAGKTTLTERLLYAAGVIDEIGSVDAGTTQTDSLDLERRRGITIRSAVVSLVVDGVTVNLIDTPGHPDFIAEVERVLSILDGAVVVVSAVEGVQPQTRVLMRALRRLHVPTLLFVNKIDRPGADRDRVLRAIASRLAVTAIPMGATHDIGTRSARFTPWHTDDPAFRALLAEALTRQNDTLLAAYVADEASLTAARMREELVAQTRSVLVHPVFFGSAITGEGVAPLMAGLVELLPVGTGGPDGPVSGRIFTIERGPSGEKVAYVRMFSGTLHVRDRVRDDEKVTAISVSDGGRWVRSRSVRAGEIGKLWGLAGIRIGDSVGQPCKEDVGTPFAPPTLGAVIAARRPQDRHALRIALTHLADQDPLINVGQDGAVSLYGEVQKEVIQATLKDDYGIEVDFHETTTICVERPARTAEAVVLLHGESNPYLATIGLRVDPAPEGSGVEFHMRVDARDVPLYIFKSVDAFAGVMAQHVRQALREGPAGWQVTDCTVTMIRCGYSSPDGPPTTRGPLSTAADFRKLTPVVLRQALELAGTVVCEPVMHVRVEVPAETVGAVLTVLARLGAAGSLRAVQRDLSTIDGMLPAARVPELRRQLPELTGGEGVLEAEFAGYRPTRRPRPASSAAPAPDPPVGL